MARKRRSETKRLKLEELGVGLHHSNPQDPAAEVVATMSQSLEGSENGSVSVYRLHILMPINHV